MASPRQVLVDDTDPSITFAGTWGHDQGISGIADPFDAKLMGDAYNNTSTFTEGNSSLSFSFTGSQVFVTGGINFAPVTSYGSCFIDGKLSDDLTDLMVNQGIKGTNNNYLCYIPQLSEGTHNLTINLTGMGTFPAIPGASGATNRVWVDQVMYQPTSSVDLDTVPAVLVESTDPQLEYSQGWQAYTSGTIQLTRTPGSSVSFTFNGTSMAYFGTLLLDTPTIASSASYTIDDQPAITFPLIAFNSGSTPAGTALFRSGPLPAGQHKLTVTNLGKNTSVVALAMGYIEFQPSPVDLSSSSSVPVIPVSSVNTNTGPTPVATSSSGNITSTPSATLPANTTGLASSSGSNSKLTTTAKAGIAVGAVLGLLLLLLVLFFVRRYRQKKRTLVVPGNSDAFTETKLTSPVILSTNTTVPVPFPLQAISSTSIFTSGFSGSPVTNPGGKQMYGRQEYARGPRRTQERDSVSDIIVAHADSGLRIPQPKEELSHPRRVIEYPPTYTP